MSEGLPEGWTWATPDDLAAPARNALAIGPFGSNLKVSDYTNDGTPLVFVRDIRTESFGGPGTSYVSTDKANELSSHIVRPGDVLVTKMGDPPGDTTVYPGAREPGVITADCIKLTPDTRLVSAEFLKHCMREGQARSQIASETRGVAQEKLSLQRFRVIRLSLPPPGEQIRIVATIEALMAEVSATRARLARVRLILKRFRQAVLAAACSGRLTEDWRQGSEGDTGDLAEDTDLPSTWQTTTMGQLTALVTSGSRGWAEFYAEDGPLFIRAQDIKYDVLAIDEVAHVRPPAGAEGTRTRAQQHDLLITITGANVTKTALVKQFLPEAYVSQHVALVRPMAAEVSEWLHLWTVSPAHGRKELLDAAYGAGKPGLNLGNVRNMAVAMPPLAEQAEIVRRVTALFALADTIERRVALATARADKIPQAILTKAFRGELVPTEAELARAEGRTYEPASALLSRIRAERGKAPEPGAKAPRRRGARA